MTISFWKALYLHITKLHFHTLMTQIVQIMILLCAAFWFSEYVQQCIGINMELYTGICANINWYWSEAGIL